ncbi:MAG: IS3 family transposase, partial [Thermoproteota archaeon]
LQIEGVSRRKKRKGSKDRAEMLAFPDLVRRDFSATRADELWVADITYIPMCEGWLYLAAVVDVFGRRCCGRSTRNDLSCDLVTGALGMAVTLRRPGPGTIRHSDRGSRYGSLPFGKTLRESGVIPSMGSKGDPYEGACAESFFPTLKMELIRRARFRTRDEARLTIFSYIEGFLQSGKEAFIPWLQEPCGV